MELLEKRLLKDCSFVAEKVYILRNVFTYIQNKGCSQLKACMEILFLKNYKLSDLKH